jgi:hypothetical protein
MPAIPVFFAALQLALTYLFLFGNSAECTINKSTHIAADISFVGRFRTHFPNGLILVTIRTLLWLQLRVEMREQSLHLHRIETKLKVRYLLSESRGREAKCWSSWLAIMREGYYIMN